MSIKNKYFSWVNLSRNELILVVGLWSFIFGLFLFTLLGPNYFERNSPKEFTIEKGEPFSKVVDDLFHKEIIGSSSSFKIVAFLYGASTKVKAGKYLIENGLNYFQLVKLLIRGARGNQVLVTIPEGIWQHNLAKLLERKLKVSSKKFMKLSKDRSFLNSLHVVANNLEGYLLPNTYYFYENSSTKDVIRKLKTEMDKIFTEPAVIKQMVKLDMNKHEILTLASIVDGETNKESEFKLIAGVYYNRLRRGILLQADPTIQYLKRNRKSRNKVYYKDLEINSPYNTYKYKGLPPGPINNPGKDAILATIFPAKTDYIFFVADGTGGHKFAKKNSEHNRNVRAYRRWRRSQ